MEFKDAIARVKDALKQTGTVINEGDYDKFIVKELLLSNVSKAEIYKTAYDQIRDTLQRKGFYTDEQINDAIKKGSFDKWDSKLDAAEKKTNSKKLRAYAFLSLNGKQTCILYDEFREAYCAKKVFIWIQSTNYQYLIQNQMADFETINFTSDMQKTLVDVNKSKNRVSYTKTQTAATGCAEIQYDFMKFGYNYPIFDFEREKFIRFINLLHADDYLIILKKREPSDDEHKYEMYAILRDDGIEKLQELEGNFYEDSEMEPMNLNTFDFNELEFSKNRILFGAPGTGKSYKLNKDKEELLKFGVDCERAMFHPDYTYAKFVGAYKPAVARADNKITYEYIPGPFMRTLVKALKNLEKPHLLIIEEINRANAAAVFGDVFQLLDRDESGNSEYPINTSDEMRRYLASEFGADESKFEQIQIPSNMFIWATMNSADQGVYPMDTAFKRRWDFTYLGIDNCEEEINGYNFELNGISINWNRLRKAINSKLASLKINEDKLLGPFFIPKQTLDAKNDEKFIEDFKNKVLMYLFEDAAKHKKNELFSQDCVAEEGVFLYSKLCEKFDEKGYEIFTHDIVKKMENSDDI